MSGMVCSLRHLPCTNGFIGQVKGDGVSSCFSNLEDTGVPALQKWCHQLTIASRERAARTFLTHVKAFAHSIQTYVEGNNEVTASDREHLRKKWESQTFGDHSAVDNDMLNLLQHLGSGIGDNLYSINPKVDADGETIGITPRLCKVGPVKYILWMRTHPTH